MRDRTTQILDDGNAIFEFRQRKTKKRATQGLDRRQPVKGSPSQKHLESWNFGISKERIIIYILLLLLQTPILYPKSITFQSQTQPKPNSNFPPILEPIPAFLPNFTVHPFLPHLSTPTNQVIHRNPTPCLSTPHPQEDTVTILGYNYCIICKVVL